MVLKKKEEVMLWGWAYVSIHGNLFLEPLLPLILKGLANANVAE
jgi:hypothetical protein